MSQNEPRFLDRKLKLCPNNNSLEYEFEEKILNVIIENHPDSCKELSIFVEK